MDFKKAARLIDKTKIGALIALGIGATFIMFVNAVSRYLFNYSFVWAEEIIRILFVWSMFIAITDSFLRNEHIGFTNIAEMNAFTRSLSKITNSLCLIVVGGLLAYFGAKYDRMTGEVPLPGTNLPTSLFMWPGIGAGAIWTVLGCVRFAEALKDLRTRRPGSASEN